MAKKYSDKEINNVMTLYTLLCSTIKEASIKYLAGIGSICKTEDSSQRKQFYKKRIMDLLEVAK